MKRVLILLLCLFATFAHAQDDWGDKRSADRFPELDWLVGEWQGIAEFPTRAGYVHKSYEYDVAGMFLTERTMDMFPPAEPSPDYEIHQDLAVYYRNTSTGVIQAKWFFVESYVASYDLEVSEDGQHIVIESTHTENAPPGLRTRFTIDRQGEDGYTMLFELAMPGGEYSEMETLTLKRMD